MGSALFWIGSMVGALAGEPAERPSLRGPFGQASEPVNQVKDQLQQEKTAEELETEQRVKDLRAAQAQKAARILVLQWRDSKVDYTNETLQRNIRTRIGRPSGRFYPDVDLYQAGRKEPDPNLRPLDQRARVPDSVIPIMEAAVREQQSIPWNALDDTEWGKRAHNLREISRQVWFVDRPELRQPLFLLYTEIGRAAENSNNPRPPYFEEVAGVPVNYYYYLAAAMASLDPVLMSALTNTEMYANIDNLKRQLEQRAFSPMTLNFELAGSWNAEQFATQYKPFFNGLWSDIRNEAGIYDVPPGLVDIYLERPGDGHGMSVRLEEVKQDDQKIYGVRDQARKRVGLDFIDQLMKNPGDCMPDLDGDLLNYLAIYQKLHPNSEIYIAVPEAGSVHKIHLWRWIRDQGLLVKIQDETGGFPVRFVALLGTGLTISGATFGDPTQTFQPPQPGQQLSLNRLGNVLKPKPSSLPFSYELRGHWSRLMVGLGMDYALNLPDGAWREVYRTRHKEHVVQEVGAGSGIYRVTEDRILTQQQQTGGGEIYHIPTLREQTWQRGAFLTIGGVFGKDAAYGFGPRIAGRTGWYNTPRAVDASLHAGWSIKPPMKKNDATKRVWPVIDTNFFGGVLLPYRDSIHLITNTRFNVQLDDDEYIQREGGGSVWVPMEKGNKNGDGCLPNTGCEYRAVGNPIPNFGFSMKVGLTF